MNAIRCILLHSLCFFLALFAIDVLLLFPGFCISCQYTVNWLLDIRLAAPRTHRKYTYSQWNTSFKLLQIKGNVENAVIVLRAIFVLVVVIDLSRGNLYTTNTQTRVRVLQIKRMEFTTLEYHLAPMNCKLRKSHRIFIATCVSPNGYIVWARQQQQQQEQQQQSSQRQMKLCTASIHNFGSLSTGNTERATGRANERMKSPTDTI